jgi:hypothetical protein
MKAQTITLKIIYDENMVEPPAQWDWTTLLDLYTDESVEVQDVKDHELV